ncbi:uncharacterized protein ARMOST_19685 [Armillaria ostoyae]|uniref:Uncharacterized protein n=1 Tax=Armillaria ostoyae TaxID=47428 RepID=A0A284S5D6_ARMOS|nr:uncharacterized protein ARMOST_19685 [Armillaria ostoyae]
MRFDAAASLALLERIREEKFSSSAGFTEEMEQYDQAIADANQRRVHNRQFDVLRLLAYLARCFCPDPKRCVAAVLGEPRTQTRSAEVDLDEEPSNDDEPDDNDDGDNDHDDPFSNFYERLEDLLESELSSASDPQAEYDDSVEYLYTTPPPPSPNAATPSEACLVLLLADNWSPSIPPYFDHTSSLVKKNLYECIHLPDDTHRWYRLIVLGRKTSSPWLDEAFTKLLDSITDICDNVNPASQTRTDSNMLDSLDKHLTRWKSNGGVEVEGQASEYEKAFLQLRSHFLDVDIESIYHDDASFIDNPISAGQFLRAILTCILRHRVSSANTGIMVVIAKDANVSNAFFVVLLLAMAIFAESGFMNDLRQVPAPSSISESQVVGVRLRRFRRRWLRIVSLARGARSVAVVGLPFMTSLMDRTHETQEEFDRCFQIIWAQPLPRLPIEDVSPEGRPSPRQFIARLGEAPVGKNFGWKDALIAGAWKKRSWSIRVHAEVQLAIYCKEMGFKIVKNTLGVTKRPCLACDHTLSQHVPRLYIPSGSKKPFRTWALPDRFPTTSDLSVIVADVQKSLLDELVKAPQAQTNAPTGMSRKENTSDSSYGSVGGETVLNDVDWTKLAYIEAELD